MGRAPPQRMATMPPRGRSSSLRPELQIGMLEMASLHCPGRHLAHFDSLAADILLVSPHLMPASLPL